MSAYPTGIEITIRCDHGICPNRYTHIIRDTQWPDQHAAMARRASEADGWTGTFTVRRQQQDYCPDHTPPTPEPPA